MDEHPKGGHETKKAFNDLCLCLYGIGKPLDIMGAILLKVNSPDKIDAV